MNKTDVEIPHVHDAEREEWTRKSDFVDVITAQGGSTARASGRGRAVEPSVFVVYRQRSPLPGGKKKNLRENWFVAAKFRGLPHGLKNTNREFRVSLRV